MAGDRPDQDNLRMRFSTLNADFSSRSADLLRSRRPSHASVKEGYRYKKWLFYSYWLVWHMKTVADRHRIKQFFTTKDIN